MTLLTKSIDTPGVVGKKSTSNNINTWPFWLILFIRIVLAPHSSAVSSLLWTFLRWEGGVKSWLISWFDLAVGYITYMYIIYVLFYQMLIWQSWCIISHSVQGSGFNSESNCENPYQEAWRLAERLLGVSQFDSLLKPDPCTLWEIIHHDCQMSIW